MVKNTPLVQNVGRWGYVNMQLKTEKRTVIEREVRKKDMLTNENLLNEDN